ncbi:MAG: Mth938-like domain-containing protein [Pseudomonadota bacterium]
MDVTPAIPADRQVIDGYGDGGFRIAKTRHNGPVIVGSTATTAWPEGATLDEAAAAAVVAAVGGAADVVLFGAGPVLTPPPMAFRSALKTAGLRIEPMDTGAACRTFNVLLSEDRRVAAALLPI